MPSTALMIAIGSPLTNALGIAGSVMSHAVSAVSGARRSTSQSGLGRGPTGLPAAGGAG